jgi:hypothetical protein
VAPLKNFASILGFQISPHHWQSTFPVQTFRLFLKFRQRIVRYRWRWKKQKGFASINHGLALYGIHEETGHFPQGLPNSFWNDRPTATEKKILAFPPQLPCHLRYVS